MDSLNGSSPSFFSKYLGQLEPDGTAVAINEEVVPRGQWAKTDLNDGDRIEILGAVSGG